MKYRVQYPTSKYSETVRNRLTELRDEGFVVEEDKVTCPISKRKVIAWKAIRYSSEAKKRALFLKIGSIDNRMESLTDQRIKLIKEIEAL